MLFQHASSLEVGFSESCPPTLPPPPSHSSPPARASQSPLPAVPSSSLRTSAPSPARVPPATPQPVKRFHRVSQAFPYPIEMLAHVRKPLEQIFSQRADLRRILRQVLLPPSCTTRGAVARCRRLEHPAPPIRAATVRERLRGIQDRID